ncbi:endopeptidase La [Candidatus Wirthbacteria bacterium CG2_30_54_11]|uniref:Lon protease n=1 Tax=Candidatus Wirthbacteria bacterium CG2_30_54_11 TaxID=1817892 RepID=A0A1J5IRJ7_9BACT|nr:MAG: endopeptidase La [Candidatus Wirthbacteria bacterium CG2_30_54_11]
MVIDRLKSKITENLEQFTSNEIQEIPEELSIIPLKDSVVFPLTVSPIKIEKKESIEAIEQAMGKNKIIGVVAFREGSKEHKPENLYGIGTAVLIHKMLKIPNQGLVLIVQGLEKIRIQQLVQTEPFWRAKVEILPEETPKTEQSEALMRNALAQIQKLISLVPYLPEELQVAASEVDDPLKLAYLIASLIRMKLGEKQEILELPDHVSKLKKSVSIMNREVELLELGSKIQSDVQGELDKSKKEYFLRQQLRAIQKELGEDDDGQAEIEELTQKIEAAKLPAEVSEEAQKELKRLKRMPPSASEYHVIRTYLDWLIEIPWSVQTEDNLDLKQARTILDDDHYDLKKIKDRIVEYLAVRKLKNDMKGPILCLIGPPGVGKTSLGKSIARALGRKFIRQSLGGMHDEAEIRGHRKTYIGAMPGKIIQSLKRAGTNNPVFMLDEIDKIGQDFRGDPSSALLEVLDPEQNNTFMDHYLGLNFDLSKVLFIATGNSADTIQKPLLDRMEVLYLSGYSLEEKMHIAQKYLVPKQIREHGLDAAKVTFSEDSLKKLIGAYTRESGVRNLEREIANVCRKIATRVATGNKHAIAITPARIEKFLGQEKVTPEVAQRTSKAGVATGLAWTPSGGEILFIEATKMPGEKGLMLTGQLGEVMQESAKTALSLIRSRAAALKIDPDFFKKMDLHLHVPAGAIPKDGPSAGITMATALTSLLLDRPVNKDIAMTGEITLSGLVLPIGGLKEKTLAAKRAGITTLIVPKRNKKDIDEIDKELLKGLRFIFVDTIEEVLKHALLSPVAAPAKKATAQTKKTAVQSVRTKKPVKALRTK